LLYGPVESGAGRFRSSGCRTWTQSDQAENAAQRRRAFRAIRGAPRHRFSPRRPPNSRPRALDGARVDEIARKAGVNKRMIYHYFGGKEGLYLAALEATYADIRTAEIGLKLADKDPVEGMRELVNFTWNYFSEHPEFLSMLGTENLHRAAFLKKSKKIRQLHSPLIGMIADLLERGAKKGVFRRGVDPVELYISIAGLGWFYMSNRFTLSTIFGRDLTAREALEQRGRAHPGCSVRLSAAVIRRFCSICEKLSTAVMEQKFHSTFGRI
jgi:AcrR family transcriptional regulator